MSPLSLLTWTSLFLIDPLTVSYSLLFFSFDGTRSSVRSSGKGIIFLFFFFENTNNYRFWTAIIMNAYISVRNSCPTKVYLVVLSLIRTKCAGCLGQFKEAMFVSFRKVYLLGFIQEQNRVANVCKTSLQTGFRLLQENLCKTLPWEIFASEKMW